MFNRLRGRSRTVAHVRFTPKADKYQIASLCPVSAKSRREQQHAVRGKAELFDHLVGARKQHVRHGQTECLGGFEIRQGKRGANRHDV